MKPPHPNPMVGYAWLAGATICMAPTALALAGGVLLGLIDLAAYGAVHNQTEDPGVLAFTLVFTLVAALVGGAVLAFSGLFLHTLGAALSALAYRSEHRVLGALLGLMHVAMLLVDILFLGGWLTLTAVDANAAAALSPMPAPLATR